MNAYIKKANRKLKVRDLSRAKKVNIKLKLDKNYSFEPFSYFLYMKML